MLGHQDQLSKNRTKVLNNDKKKKKRRSWGKFFLPQVEGTTIKCYKEVKYLGVILNDKLLSNKHIYNRVINHFGPVKEPQIVGVNQVKFFARRKNFYVE